MAEKKNYLIGRGELLTEPVGPPKIKPDKVHPYTPDEARVRLAPQLTEALGALTDDPKLAPGGVQVIKFALHPSYVAKSYYPEKLFQQLGLEPVGSRERAIRPTNHVQKDWEDKRYATSEIFVAGSRDDFVRFESLLSSTVPLTGALEAVREIEEITAFPAAEKVRPAEPEDSEFELVLHLPSELVAPDNRTGFLDLATELEVEVREDLGFQVRGLWFLPARGAADRVAKLAEFTTVRVARPMPGLSVSPVARTFVSVPTAATLPPEGRVLDPELRVAVLDGGLPAQHPLQSWVDSYREMNPAADNVEGYEQHGLAVASAFLFGALEPGKTAPVPPARISVFRVLDSSTAGEDPFELYRTLGHVEEVLLSRSFDFVNLSLGPTLPIEDDEVHAWTSLIDDLLSDGETLLTVAVGNNGESDWASGNGRIQVPGDAVNALSVGAFHRSGGSWERAKYSAVGPGRSPGRIKPDVLAFGGSPSGYFHFLAADASAQLVPGQGTSLASPLALRQGAAVRALLGQGLSPLAIRALLIHAADPETHASREVGWGRLPDSLDEIVAAGDGVARILYQGELKPGKYLRAQVPTPRAGFQGMVTLSATFCFASPVDAQSPDVYTRAGLEVRFRPDLGRTKKNSTTPTSRSFFTPAPYADESALRSEDGKWETVLRASDRMQAATLGDPVFDIHYMARDSGGSSRETDPLRYALVITIESPKTPDLHDSILAAYPGVLVPIEPRIDITDLPAT